MNSAIKATNPIFYALTSGCGIAGLVVTQASQRLEAGQLAEKDVWHYINAELSRTLTRVYSLPSNSLIFVSATQAGEYVAARVRPYLPQNAAELRANAQVWNNATEYTLKKYTEIRQPVTEARLILQGLPPQKY